MELFLYLIKEIDPVAAYAALISTLLAIGELVRWWRSGPRLRIRATPDMHFVTDDGMSHDAMVYVQISNIGTEQTTLEKLSTEYRPSFKGLICKQHRKLAVVVRPEMHPQFALPFLLRPGEQWTGRINQDQQIESWLNSGLFYIQAHHSFSLRPTRKRASKLGSLWNTRQKVSQG